MKQVTMKQFITILLTLWLVQGCRKETVAGQDISTVNQAQLPGEIAGPPDNTAARTYNLLDEVNNAKLKEGDNVISILDNNVKAIARVKNGRIMQWILQNKTGKQFLPQSTEKLAQQFTRPGGLHIPVYRICFYLDGLWFCAIVLGF